MTLKLTPEQREALDRTEGPVSFEDAETHRVYVLLDEPTYQELRQHVDLVAIREGIADAEAGRVAELGEAMSRIRSKLGLGG